MLNNPVRFNDPTGHWSDENAPCGVQGDHCGSGTQYSVDLPDYDEGAKGDGNPRSSTERKRKRIQDLLPEVDRLFDPFMGAYPYYGLQYDEPFPSGISPAEFDAAMHDAYAQLSIDLSYYAANSLSNPLTDDIFLEWGESDTLGIDQLHKQAFYINAQHKPYGIFLQYAGIPSDDAHYLNCEANYLSALMMAKPGALQKAKEDYMRTVLQKDPSIWQQLFNEGTPLWPASGGPSYE